MATVRITVIDKIVMKDLRKEYAKRQFAEGEDASCDKFKVGDTFTHSTGGNIPEGFCAWAWADIHRDVEAVKFGASFPWINREQTQIACCTDGLRPVFFKIERID